MVVKRGELIKRVPGTCLDAWLQSEGEDRLQYLFCRRNAIPGTTPAPFDCMYVYLLESVRSASVRWFVSNLTNWLLLLKTKRSFGGIFSSNTHTHIYFNCEVEVKNRSLDPVFEAFVPIYRTPVIRLLRKASQVESRHLRLCDTKRSLSTQTQ